MLIRKGRYAAALGLAVTTACLFSLGCDEVEPTPFDGDTGGTEANVQPGPMPEGDVEPGPDIVDEPSEPDVSVPDAEAIPITVTELRYEKIIHHVEGPENKVSVIWTHHGVIKITRPLFMTYPGNHEFEIGFDLDERWELTEAMESLPESSEALATRTRARMAEDLLFISDPEISTLEFVKDDPSEPAYRIEATGVQFWAEAYRDDEELARLAALENQIWDLMTLLLKPDEDD
ncbi:MAG: hypothetical protein ACNA8W_11870 [Bradymonadaceae bacterium]